MSRHPTFKAPLPSSHDELFFIKSIQAFHNALNWICTPFRSKIVSVGQISHHNRLQPTKRYDNIGGNIRHLQTKAVDQSSPVLIDQLDSCNQCRSSSIEGVAFNNQLINQSLEDKLYPSYDISSLEGVQSCSQSISQSQARMKNRDFTFSSREVVFSCSSLLDQSQLSMQMRYAKPEVCERNHCLRPYFSESSYTMDASNNLSRNSTLNSTLNISNTFTNSIDLADNTFKQATLLLFVENFSSSSPNFCAPSQQRC